LTKFAPFDERKWHFGGKILWSLPGPSGTTQIAGENQLTHWRQIISVRHFHCFIHWWIPPMHPVANSIWLKSQTQLQCISLAKMPKLNDTNCHKIIRCSQINANWCQNWVLLPNWNNKVKKVQFVLKCQIWLIWHFKMLVGNPFDAADNRPLRKNNARCATYRSCCARFAARTQQRCP